MQGPQLNKTVEVSDLPAACGASSSTVRATYQGRSFQARSSLISLGLVAKDYGVFSQGVLQSSF